MAIAKPHRSQDNDLPTARAAAADSNHGHSHTGEHAHVHDPESLQRILNRFARIEGHIRGIKTMIQDSRPCPDVLVQIAAVRGGARSRLADHFG